MKKYLQKMLKNTSLLMTCLNGTWMLLQKKSSFVLATQILLFLLLSLISPFANLDIQAILIGGLCIILSNMILFLTPVLPASVSSLVTMTVLKYAIFAGLVLIFMTLSPTLWPQALLGIIIAQLAYLASCYIAERVLWR